MSTGTLYLRSTDNRGIVQITSISLNEDRLVLDNAINSHMKADSEYLLDVFVEIKEKEKAGRTDFGNLSDIQKEAWKELEERLDKEYFCNFRDDPRVLDDKFWLDVALGIIK